MLTTSSTTPTRRVFRRGAVASSRTSRPSRLALRDDQQRRRLDPCSDDALYRQIQSRSFALKEQSRPAPPQHPWRSTGPARSGAHPRRRTTKPRNAASSLGGTSHDSIPGVATRGQPSTVTTSRAFSSAVFSAALDEVRDQLEPAAIVVIRDAGHAVEVLHRRRG